MDNYTYSSEQTILIQAERVFFPTNDVCIRVKAFEVTAIGFASDRQEKIHASVCDRPLQIGAFVKLCGDGAWKFGPGIGF